MTVALLERAPTGIGSTAVGGPEQVWTLVDAAKAGGKAAVARLYELHVDEVFRFVLSRTGNRRLAEDITSETFLRALRRIHTLTYRGTSFGSWLMTIARNLVLDEMKSARRRHETVLPESYDMVADTPDPARAACAQELAGELRGYLAQLTKDQRRCLELRFYHGLSVPEVAERMARNPRAVSAIQLRALRKLAEVLVSAGWKTVAG